MGSMDTRAGERMAWRAYWRRWWVLYNTHPWVMEEVATRSVKSRVWLHVYLRTPFVDSWLMPVQDSIRAIVAKE